MERDTIMDLAELRCQCGKIVAQQQKRKIYIKCRHCKRLIIIEPRLDDAGLEIKYK